MSANVYNVVVIPVGHWLLVEQLWRALSAVSVSVLLQTWSEDGVLTPKALARGTRQEFSDDGLHRQLLLVCLACASGQKQSRRRPHNGFIKPIFPGFTAPQQRTPPPPPPPPPASVEVEQAEVHSEEFLQDQNFQGPFQQQQQQQQQQSFSQGHNNNEFHQSFRHGGTTPSPKERPTPIPIIRLEKQQSLDGSYKSNYETANSIQAEETGFLKNIGNPEQEALVQFGSYSYTDPDGQVVSLSYTADEGGFRATGSHIPTPPPVPPEVQKGLDIIFESIRQDAERKAKEKKLKGSKLEVENYPIQFQDGQFDNQPRTQSKSSNQGRQPVRH